jgi:hypothetical protein
MSDQVVARTLYASLEELQSDLDVWLDEYNIKREHSGKYCYGKNPVVVCSSPELLIAALAIN